MTEYPFVPSHIKWHTFYFQNSQLRQCTKYEIIWNWRVSNEQGPHLVLKEIYSTSHQVMPECALGNTKTNFFLYPKSNIRNFLRLKMIGTFAFDPKLPPQYVLSIKRPFKNQGHEVNRTNETFVSSSIASIRKLWIPKSFTKSMPIVTVTRPSSKWIKLMQVELCMPLRCNVSVILLKR